MVKINTFEAENIKRIKAVKINIGDGLTVIGGDNAQGKTSVIDALAWVLGGNKFSPSNPIREGSSTPANIKVTLSNGLIVERKGKNSTLTVTDPAGLVGGQALLNSFISELSLNLPKFMEATSKEKAKILLELSGVEAELKQIEADEKVIYDNRTLVGREKDRKEKHALDLEFFEGLPEAPINAADLIKEQQEVLSKNGDNERKRQELTRLENIGKNLQEKVAYKQSQLDQLQKEFDTAKDELEKAREGYRSQKAIVENLEDSSTDLIQEKLTEIDTVNAKIRKNLDKVQAQEQAQELVREYQDLTKSIDELRLQKTALLDSVQFPLPDLSILDGELIYKGAKWDCMSGAEQLIVSCSIARELNKECGFVLMDKLEQMDKATLKAFAEWLNKEGLQVIGTRVSKDDECTIIIEDGLVAEVREPKTIEEKPQPKTFVKGQF
jgi:DNA repair ATPase RecN